MLEIAIQPPSLRGKGGLLEKWKTLSIIGFSFSSF